MTRAPIALTCGDPAGVGPELAVLAWKKLGKELPFFLIGDPAHLPAGTPIVEILAPADTAMATRDGIPVLRHDFPAPATTGVPDPTNAQCVIDVIARAVDLVRKGAASALTTAPINKKALKDGAEFAHPGHTEYLAALTDTDHVVMMLASPDLKVVPVTIHIALRDVTSALTPDLLKKTIRITHRSLIRDFAIPAPRLGIAGLNPHAGEGGVMGREEIDIIEPVLEDLRNEGHDIVGPLSADTMFHTRARQSYDAAICMYHDQALIPIKTLDFDRGVNVTLGLPIIRTSPDHGTAMDIAGKGIADPTSLIQALRLAQTMSIQRERHVL